MVRSTTRRLRFTVLATRRFLGCCLIYFTGCDLTDLTDL